MHPKQEEKAKKVLAALYMLRLRFHVGRLFTLGRLRRLPLSEVDPGYLVHCQMDELFGDNSPRPFNIIHESDRYLNILAYSGREEEDLRNYAQTFADPGIFQGCDWDAFSSKKMPDSWKADAIIGFQLRCIPTVTKKNDEGKNDEGKDYEVDAFLSSCMAADARGERIPGREEVYNHWLAKNIWQHSNNGAVLLNSELKGWHIAKLLRRKGPPDHRTSTTIEKPEATITGHIRITDPEGFAALLSRGVGKHLPFGYGMLLLKPPQ